ncbi:hypothetical protein EDB84DRAFT_1444718 [Lactarius hengduanensis]|nr:hypothetical protein EDB84DRAFT_1444718 [Lactarius hengduanensis]
MPPPPPFPPVRGTPFVRKRAHESTLPPAPPLPTWPRHPPRSRGTGGVRRQTAPPLYASPGPAPFRAYGGEVGHPSSSLPPWPHHPVRTRNAWVRHSRPHPRPTRVEGGVHEGTPPRTRGHEGRAASPLPSAVPPCTCGQGARDLIRGQGGCLPFGRAAP